MGNKRKPPTAQAGGSSSGSSKKKKFTKGPKAKPQPSKQQDVPLPPGSDEDDDQGLDIGEEDLQFVQQYGAQLGFLRDLDAQQLDKAVKDKQKAAAAAAAAAAADSDDDGAAGADGGSEDEGAAEYERKPRAAEQVTKASKYGLPVKTAAGEIVFQPTRKQQLTAAKVQVEGIQVEDTLQSEKAQKAAEKEAAAAEAAERRAAAAAEKQAAAKAAAAAEAAAKKGLPAEAGLPPALLSLMSLQDSQQRREALKQQMALAAQHLLAEPDKHVGPGLRLLLGCAADRDGTVVRLALLSLLAVFKDLLPGYRIRSLTEEEQEMRVSKEVQALRDFEQALLKGYQAYLKTLLAAATAKPTGTPTSASHSSSSMLATKRVAVRCMGQLLVARPGFNYCSDLLQALVPMMLGPDAQVQAAACDAIRQLLQEDVQGKSSLEAVQLVADLVKTRKCSVPPVVVSCLLVLRFEQVMPVSAGGEGAGGGKAKKLGKKAARRATRKTDLDKEFEEAEAGPDLAQLALLQSQMLEALFEVFFRVLKHCSAATSNQAAAAAAAAAAAVAAAADDEGSSSKGVLQQPWPASKVHRKFPLLQPALEGLGRYSHLISVEYFNDLMAVLQELLAAGALPLRERLGVLLAALDILKGQGEALTIDRRAFYNQLYQALLLVPLQLLHEAGDFPAKFAGKLAGNGAAAANGSAGDEEGQWLDQEDLQALQAVRASLLGLEVAAAEQQQQQQQQQQKGAAGSASSPSSSSSSNRDVAPTPVLLLRCLEQQLLGVKQTDMGRLAAYAKRLAQLLLSSSTPEALGCGCLLYRLMRRYPKLACLLEWEGGAPVGGRQFDADCSDPSEAGALAAALWELPLLAQHYHPHIAAAARMLLTLTPGSGSGAGGTAAAAGGSSGDGDAAAGTGAAVGAAVIAGASGPQDVAAVYGPVKLGGFKPAPLMPAAAGGRGKGRVNGVVAGSSKAGMAARQAAASRAWCQDLQQAVAAAAMPEQQSQQVQQQGKQKQQPQQRQQQQQAAVVAAAVAAADAEDLHGVEQALQEQYRLSKLYRRNNELRRELAVSAKKVELFREHLITKRQQEEQQQQQQVRPGKQEQQQPVKKKHRQHA